MKFWNQSKLWVDTRVRLDMWYKTSMLLNKGNISYHIQVPFVNNQGEKNRVAIIEVSQKPWGWFEFEFELDVGGRKERKMFPSLESWSSACSIGLRLHRSCLLAWINGSKCMYIIGRLQSFDRELTRRLWMTKKELRRKQHLSAAGSYFRYRYRRYFTTKTLRRLSFEW